MAVWVYLVTVLHTPRIPAAMPVGVDQQPAMAVTAAHMVRRLRCIINRYNLTFSLHTFRHRFIIQRKVRPNNR